MYIYIYTLIDFQQLFSKVLHALTHYLREGFLPYPNTLEYKGKYGQLCDIIITKILSF